MSLTRETRKHNTGVKAMYGKKRWCFNNSYKGRHLVNGYNYKGTPPLITFLCSSGLRKFKAISLKAKQMKRGERKKENKQIDKL